MTDNGDKYVTHKDFIGYQDKFFEAINRHSEKVIETVDKRLSDIVCRLGVVEEIQAKCNKAVEPVIERHKNVNKFIWAIITTIIASLGGIIGWLLKIGDTLNGLR